MEPTPEAKAPKLPYWANSEGLAPDPDRPGFDMAGDPFKGDPDAKVVVVEFSDFQCPACRTHALETQPALDQTLVKTGKVMWVFKDLPLRSHPQSAAAAAAAECAGDQAKFWEMYHQLFQQQKKWAVDDPDPALVALAGELGLDLSRFGKCLDSRQVMERVLADVYDAQGVVDSTPSFVLLYGGKGGILRGSRPADQFVSTVENLIKSAEAQGGSAQ